MTVIQVKHFKFKKNFSSSKSFTTIVNQLTTSLKKRIHYTDKTLHVPFEVCLFSTFPVDAKALETRFADYADWNDRKIIVKDGIQLSAHLIEHRIDLVYRLLGQHTEITSILNKDLNNEVLLRALGYQERKDLKVIYTDIDFSLGKHSTELFFNSGFKPTYSNLSLSVNQWQIFKNICLMISREFGLSFLSMTLEEVVETYNIEREGHLAELKKQLEAKKQNTTNKDLQSIAEFDKPKPVLYRIGIDGDKIVRMITEKRLWIEQSVAKINIETPGPTELKLFIQKCQSIFECAALFFQHTFFECTGFDKVITNRSSFESTRLKIPIHIVYDSGVNVLVLGEAGAGKTTSLQMYSLNNEYEVAKLYIPISLSSLSQFRQINSATVRLDEVIAEYISSRGISITPQQIILHFQNKQIVLLLDGLDEVIKDNPSLPKVIRRLGNDYSNNLQIIVTSRSSGSQIDQIPYFAVTILPFTPRQRTDFIDKWFDDNNRKKVNRIISHLEKNPGLAEVVNTPLLTTILCVLANNEIALPNTEIKLYNERIKLLTGYYDRIKNIPNRIISSPQILEFLAQKIAYYFHHRVKRDEHKKELIETARHLTLFILSGQEAEIALNELINPCNILVPMSDDGKFGFEHLRYQEHLAAKELLSDRGRDVISLLKQSWWQGCLRFFTIMNSDLTWLIKEIAKERNIIALKEQVKTLVNLRPIPERKKIIKLIETYLQVEYEDTKGFIEYLEDSDENYHIKL